MEEFALVVKDVLQKRNIVEETRGGQPRIIFPRIALDGEAATDEHLNAQQELVRAWEAAGRPTDWMYTVMSIVASSSQTA